ncbi:MAG: ROK family protein [Bryobacteraceae bacterium]
MTPRPERDKQALDQRSIEGLRTIEGLVWRDGPISRARLHALTGIRPGTVSQLVRQLLDEGRLSEAGVVHTSGLGRKTALLETNPGHGTIVGVEFDDECVTAGVLDLTPRITRLVSEPAQIHGGKDGLLAQLLSVTRRALRRTRAIGIGVADPGLVDSRRGVTLTSSTIPGWTAIPLREIFEREFRLPVLVEARTRAKAVAEHRVETADATSMIYIDYGAGIGAGLYVDGRLLYGQGSAAGEFGHTHLVMDGPVCACGSFGCLEAVAGLHAMEARVRRILAEGGRTEVLDAAAGDASRITGWMVFEAASRGDKVAANVVAEVGRYLGLGIANLVNLFNPGVIVLDARLRPAGPELLDQIQAVVRRQALREAAAQVRIRWGEVAEGAGVLGVARMVLEKHFGVAALAA